MYNKTNTNDEKFIREVEKRMLYRGDIPDSLKEEFYRGKRKRDKGYEMIVKVKLELERGEKWTLKGTRGW